MTAAVIDSLFESYPDINKDEGEVTIAALPGTANFRLQCAFVPFGGQEVYNVSGSSSDKRGGSWGAQKGFVDDHTKFIVGGHLEPEDNIGDKSW
ncbi:hypothetical protein BHE90_002240 [Fusarium euwallaceae]|uniref:Uncharacterized protein n=1 Tax=Fusarium euwallaceae TaxID=1147111 RepID=A0A430M5R9_9HYPO|nr:hypothetical protein BHE90_002240 [Fusarium euwallaceae]